MQSNIEGTDIRTARLGHRHIERSLRIDLFQRNYSTVTFDVKQVGAGTNDEFQLPSIYPSTCQCPTIEFVEVGPTIPPGARPKKMSISSSESGETADPYRQHVLTELDRKVDDEGTLEDVEIVGVRWKADLATW